MSQSRFVTIADASSSDLTAALQRSNKVRVVDSLIVGSTISLSGDDVTLDLREAQVFSGIAGGADDSANCLFNVQGTYDTSKLNTTITSDVVPGAATIPVASIGSIAAGDFIEIGCTANAGGDGYQESGPTSALAEILQVASATGTTITVKGRVRCWHDSTATGQYVRAITPVRNLTILGGEFFASGAAVGFYIKGAQSVVFDDSPKFKGFSRAGIDIARGTRQVTLNGLRHLGSNNALAIASNVVDLKATNWSYDPDADLVHASGSVRNLLCTRQRCIGVQVIDCNFGRHAGGIQLSGTHDALVKNCTFTDMDGTEKLSRTAEGVAVNHYGVAIDMGPQVIADSEFGRSADISGCIFQDIRTPTDTHAVYLHDVFQISARGLKFVYDQARSGGGNPTRYGILVSDCLGGVFIRDLQWQGNGRMLELENDGITAFYDIDGVSVNGTSYDAQAFNDWLIKYEASADNTRSLRLRNIKIGNAGNILWPAVSGGSDKVKVDWENFRFDGFPGPVAFGETARVTAGHPLTPGQLVEVDPAVTTYYAVKAATARVGAATRLLRICVSGAQIDAPLCIVMHPNTNGFVLCSSAAVNVGDLLIQDPAAVTMCMQSNASTSGILGVAKSAKAAGSTGLVEIGPAPVL